MSDLRHDSPLSDPLQDRLGRDEFAKAIADSIQSVDAEQGFVYAIQGSWGSGKTTVINFVLAFLDRNPVPESQIIQVRFNPWWFTSDESLLLRFLGELRTALGAEDIPKELGRIASILNGLAIGLAPTAVIPQVGVAAGAVSGVVGSFAAWLQRWAARKAQSLDALRQQIDDALRAQPHKLLIVIDDLDRLTSSQLRQVFQIVRSAADFPRTIYLLAFDPDKVARALDADHNEAGVLFLDKIVQAPLDLPTPDPDSLRRLFNEALDQIVGDPEPHRWDSVEWQNIYWDGIDHFLRTPRQVTRLINAVETTYPHIHEDVRPAEAIAIQALRISAHGVYEFVATHKSELTGSTDEGTKVEDRKQTFQTILETLPELDRPPIQKLLSRLFPRWEQAFRNIGYGREWLGSWYQQRKICHPEVFDLHFRLRAPMGHFRPTEISAILRRTKNPHEFADLLLRFVKEKLPNGTTRVAAFLDKAGQHIGDLSPKRAEAFLRAIYTVGDDLCVPEDVGGSFSIKGNDLRLAFVSNRLLTLISDKDDRFRILRDAFETGNALATIVDRVVWLGFDHGRRERNTKPEEEQLVSETHLIELERIALDKLRAAAKDGSLGHKPQLESLLYDWKEWGEESEIRDWGRNLTSSDQGLTIFLTGFLSLSHSHGLGDRGSRRIWRVRLKHVQTFLDIELSVLLDRTRRILAAEPPWLNERRQLALETTIQEIERPRDNYGVALQEAGDQENGETGNVEVSVDPK